MPDMAWYAEWVKTYEHDELQRFIMDYHQEAYAAQRLIAEGAARLHRATTMLAVLETEQRKRIKAAMKGDARP